MGYSGSVPVHSQSKAEAELHDNLSGPGRTDMAYTGTGVLGSRQVHHPGELLSVKWEQSGSWKVGEHGGTVLSGWWGMVECLQGNKHS